MPRLQMPRPVPTLTGTLVTLRAPAPATDARDYYEMNLDPEMHTWTGNHVLPSVEAAQKELERLVGMPDVTTWLIVDNPSKKVIGRFFVCLEKRGEMLVAGEGNRVARPFWRKGHNREARALVLRYLFEESKADRVETCTWAGNVNSVRSIESYGFEFVREERRYNGKHRAEMPMRHYADVEYELAYLQWCQTVGEAFFRRYTQERPWREGYERRRLYYRLHFETLHLWLAGNNERALRVAQAAGEIARLAAAP